MTGQLEIVNFFYWVLCMYPAQIYWPKPICMPIEGCTSSKVKYNGLLYCSGGPALKESPEVLVNWSPCTEYFG